MKTEVVMERKLFGKSIRQKHKSEMLSGSDLVKAGNLFRIENDLPLIKIEQYFSLVGTSEFLETMNEEFGDSVKLYTKGKDYWLHPYVFMDMALWINPKLKVKVYRWLHDSLLSNRDVSGNSYNKMSGIVFKHHKPFKEAKEELRNIASAIQVACNVNTSSKKKWELADETQLQLRNKIQDYICLLYPIMGSDAIDEAISKAKD